MQKFGQFAQRKEKMEEQKETKYLTEKGKSFEELDCPPLLKEAVRLISRKNNKMSSKGILNILINKTAHMVLSKKIKINNAGEVSIPNQFGMVLLASGSGKDRTLNDINNYIMPMHTQWFNNKAELQYQKDLEVYETQQIEEKCRKAKKQQEIEQKGINWGGDKNVSTADKLPF